MGTITLDADIQAVPPRRARCDRCGRPTKACICLWIRATPNEVDVLILQHPLEVHQAKGSVRLLQLSLQRCEVIVGEAWDPPVLKALLQSPTSTGAMAHNMLLYPDASDQPQSQARSAAPAASAAHPPCTMPHQPTSLRLIVLDGTWRKSLKMLHLNPALQALSRLALSTPAPSRYAIRKAHRPGQLSTLEATCQALGELENCPARYQALQAAFDGFVQAHLARAPQAPR